MFDIFTIIWLIIPCFFFILSFIDYIKNMNKKKSFDAFKFFNQAVFLLVIAIASIFIDKVFILNFLSEMVFGLIPIDLIRILLFPVLAVIGAQLTGGSEDLRISSRNR